MDDAVFIVEFTNVGVLEFGAVVTPHVLDDDFEVSFSSSGESSRKYT